jgi:pre-mRNA-splicing factor 38A
MADVVKITTTKKKPSLIVHGMEAQLLIPKIVRERIYESEYWKCNCVAVPFATTLQKARKLNYIGGTFGGNYRPTPFIALLLKLLQLCPSEEEIQELADACKYGLALVLFFWRLTLPTSQVYSRLESFLSDYRKLRVRKRDGSYYLSHVDEFVEDLLKEDSLCQIPLPRLVKRSMLEESGQLKPRQSPLTEEIEKNSDGDSENENSNA